MNDLELFWLLCGLIIGLVLGELADILDSTPNE
jgi:hypothetical protein